MDTQRAIATYQRIQDNVVGHPPTTSPAPPIRAVSPFHQQLQRAYQRLLK